MPMAISSQRVMRSVVVGGAWAVGSVVTLFPFWCRYFEVEGVWSKRAWFSPSHWLRTH